MGRLLVRGVAGLRGQVSALPLIAAGSGVARGVVPMLGIPSSAELELAATPADISRSSTSSTISSGQVTIRQRATRRAEVFRTSWRQISGPPGVVVESPPGGFYFQHTFGSHGGYGIVWRATVDNNFGLGGECDVAFNLTYYDPGPPPLSVSVSPGSLSGYRNNGAPGRGPAWTSPASVTVASGSGNYSYSWSGVSTDVGVSTSGNGTPSCAFGVDIPDGFAGSGQFFVTVTDKDTGASGNAMGSLFFASI